MKKRKEVLPKMNCMNNNFPITNENLVYLDKIFYQGQGNSCPIIQSITTDSDTFNHQLLFYNDNCCNNFNMDCNTNFSISNTCVIINSITAGTIIPSNVSIDGIPVTSMSLQEGRYYADLSGIMAEISPCPCEAVDLHLCHDDCINTCQDCPPPCKKGQHFFLAEVTGPWTVSLTIVVEGIASNSLGSSLFKLCLSTTGLSISGNNNFGLNCVDIPCQSLGMAPRISFSFGGCANLLNPTITVSMPPAQTTGTGTDTATEALISSTCPPQSEISLAASLVVTPNIKLEVTRPSLFKLPMASLEDCCDNLGQCSPCDIPESMYKLAVSPSSKQTDSCCIQNPPACQCCDTNGYRY